MRSRVAGSSTFGSYKTKGATRNVFFVVLGIASDLFLETRPIGRQILRSMGNFTEGLKEI